MFITGITNLIMEYSLIKLDSSKLAEKLGYGYILVRNQNKDSIIGDKLLKSFRYCEAKKLFGSKIIEQVDNHGYKWFESLEGVYNG